MIGQFPPGTTLAEWYRENEPLLQGDPGELERIRIVAAALLPLFDADLTCWEAIAALDDFSRGTFFEFLECWHARVPKKCRPFVRRIAKEFGVEIPGDG